MEKYEIIKRFKWCFSETTAYGRILQNVISGISSNYPYSWEISEYCSIKGEAEVYIPRLRLGVSVDDAEQNMQKYVKRFENYTSSKNNDFY